MCRYPRNARPRLEHQQANHAQCDRPSGRNRPSRKDRAPLLLYRHRWYCAPTRREAEGGTYRLRAGEAGGHIDRGARASLRSHGGSLANCDSLRARAANRLDHVTLTPGAPASAVATDTLWVSFRPRASSPRSADRRLAQVVECHSKAAVRPIELLKLGDGVRISHAVRTTTS